MRRGEPPLDRLEPQQLLAPARRPRRVAERVTASPRPGRQLAKAEPKALRFRLLGAPARHVTHARKKILRIPPGWAWAADVVTAWERLQALHPA